MKRLVVVCLAVFATEAGAQMTAQDSADAELARLLTKKIWVAAQTHYADRGQWPAAVEELYALTGLKKETPSSPEPTRYTYLQLDSSALKQWQFSLVPGPPQTIQARTTRIRRTRFEGDSVDVSAVMVNYDVLRGKWSGSGIPLYGKDTLSMEQKAILARAAKSTLQAISDAAKVFYQDKGLWPETVEELDVEHYIGLRLRDDEPRGEPFEDLFATSTYNQWCFAIIGSPPVKVIAISTGEMPGGAGKGIEYDVATGVWKGYGVE